MDERGMLTLVVALPSRAVASALGRSVDELDAVVFPAILADIAEARERCLAAAAAVEASPTVTVRTDGCLLTLDRSRRVVHCDDGVIDSDDRDSGAVVSNLPAGSVYWTVIEEATRGSVRLEDGTMLTFDAAGRVASGEFVGERVSHVGLGLNPMLTEPLGWTIVDEHIGGRLFLALGENRYMGGANASTINVDLLVADAANLAVGAMPVLEMGTLTI